MGQNTTSCRTTKTIHSGNGPWYLRPGDSRIGYHNYGNNNSSSGVCNNNKDNSDSLPYIALPHFLGGVAEAMTAPQTCLPYFGMEMQTLPAKTHKSLPDFLIPLHEIMFQHHYQQQQQQREQQRQQSLATATSPSSTMGTLINSLPCLTETFPGSAKASLTLEQPTKTTGANATPRNGEHLFVRHFHERDRLIRQHQLQQQRLRDEQEQDASKQQQPSDNRAVEEAEGERQRQPVLELETPRHNNHWHGVVYDGNGNAMTAVTAKHRAEVEAAVGGGERGDDAGQVMEEATVALAHLPVSPTIVASRRDSNIYEQANGQQHCRVGNPGIGSSNPSSPTTAHKGKFSSESLYILYFLLIDGAFRLS